MLLFEILKNLTKWMVRITFPCERSERSSPKQSDSLKPCSTATRLSNIMRPESDDSEPSLSLSSTSIEPPVVFNLGSDSPILSYIEEQDSFNASLGKPPSKHHDWLEDPLIEGSPIVVLCATCSHEWLGTILRRVLVGNIKCPECGASAGTLAD